MQRDSFTKLKELISRAETLAYFQQDSMMCIVADAGPSRLRAVLVKLQGDSWKIIVYALHYLFNLYVFGSEFELKMDYKPLECIYGKTSKPSARIKRWVLCLQGYNYKVVYYRRSVASERDHTVQLEW